VLEVGAGRGYTCMKLAPHVESITGVEVSEPSLNEARALIREHDLRNVELMHYSAQDLSKLFASESFDKVISIDVIEHLHPEDARDHLEQAYQVLKPDGCYIVVTPNRINGPHDVTQEVFPTSRKAMGFHLNETTYSDLTRQMSVMGYRKFKSFLALNRLTFLSDSICYPASLSILFERLYEASQSITAARKILSRLIPVRLIAIK
jgi:2-polyprenyl-3-methyl-5-hydroxy-6-metoxy-1,4-benzoquinol methylase